MSNKVEVVGVSKSFWVHGSRLAVLEDVNLQVKKGEFISLVGPSGCGKSTLFNILSGLLAPDAGAFYIDGQRIMDGRGWFAYMQQKDLLMPWRTVLDNAVLGMEIQGVDGAKARQEAQALLREFGLAGFERSYPGALSGGMRQRVALVRTLLCHKELLLLDEPFGALDAMTRSVMHRWLLEAWQQFDKTILFVTHDIEEATLLSDRIYVFTARPGRVKAVIDVPLSRPRQVTDPAFVRVKGRVLELLQEELQEAFAYAP